ncbi:MAG TPA: hypothetical protein VG965_03645 [Patescibacteria group bacterium]|nr:hypothetical protein [Patescibacteria group bacterium]
MLTREGILPFSLVFFKHRPSPEEIRQNDMSQYAADLFVRVSATYPASVITQGAAIALDCLNSDRDPVELGKALLLDDKRIHEVIRKAEAAHRHRGRGTVPLPVYDAKEVIDWSFSAAHIFKTIDSASLEMIQEMYRVILRQDGRYEVGPELIRIAKQELGLEMHKVSDKMSIRKIISEERLLNTFGY